MGEQSVWVQTISNLWIAGSSPAGRAKNSKTDAFASGFTNHYPLTLTIYTHLFLCAGWGGCDIIFTCYKTKGVKYEKMDVVHNRNVNFFCTGNIWSVLYTTRYVACVV